MEILPEISKLRENFQTFSCILPEFSMICLAGFAMTLELTPNHLSLMVESQSYSTEAILQT